MHSQTDSKHEITQPRPRAIQPYALAGSHDLRPGPLLSRKFRLWQEEGGRVVLAELIKNEFATASILNIYG